MSQTSAWPLPVNGTRFITPQSLLKNLIAHPIASQLYPNSLGYYPNALDHNMDRIEHDDYLLMYCVAGCGHIQFDRGQQQTIHAGDVILMPPSLASHSYSADPKNPWSIYWCHYTGTQAAQITQQLHAELPVFHYGVSSLLSQDFERLLSIQDTGYQFRGMLHTCSLLQQILTQLLIPSAAQERASGIDIEAIQQFMRDNSRENLKLDQLVALASASKYHFIREYKRMTGYAPLQHFQHLKMEQACALLDHDSLSISQTANAMGYQDPYYFSRQFKKIIGLSPKNYRQLKT